MPPLTRLKVAPQQDGPSITSSTSISARGTRQNRRAYLSPDILRQYKLVAGDWVLLRSTTHNQVIVVQSWPRVGLEEDSILLSPAHLANLNETDVELHRFSPEKHSHGRLSSITLIELPVEVSTKSKVKIEVDQHTAREQEWCRAALKEALSSTFFIRPGYVLTIGETEKTSRRFQIVSAETSTKANKPNGDSMGQLENGIEKLGIDKDVGKEVYEVDWKTRVVIQAEGEDEEVRKTGEGGPEMKVKAGPPKSKDPMPSYINFFTPTQHPTEAYALLGGLKSQIEQIKSLLDLPLLHPELFTLFGLTPPKGILLHGPPGTGKTALARAVAASSQCSCIVVNGPELSSAYHGETEERLRGVFTQAKKSSPCIVVLDEVDALCPRRDGDGAEVEKRVVATLLTLMDGMKQDDGERVFVVAATNRPNSIDPALRRPGRFDREIEIGIPDVMGRRQIIEIMLSKMPHSLTEDDISSLASRTHGYVGADLSSLIRESASAAIQRWHRTSKSSPSDSSSPKLTHGDVLDTLPTIRASAMREVYIETPNTKWTDIGGQTDIKQKLKECVEWPLTHRDTFIRLGVEPPKGVLLYGPPGCSKTMIAKALATESGINFIAVKGPELLNKYVGESERAVREIFRKARAASPSIIFFDEIDALGSARSDDHTSSGVLTSLLNEMDGVEELANVTVVAATNRPDVLDSALMRPGRLDRILYVGAPDFQTRKDIFRIRLSKMAVESGVDIDELARITEGCSGAEITSICQDAALTTMNQNISSEYVTVENLLNSSKNVRRRITFDMIRFFQDWRDQSGVRSA